MAKRLLTINNLVHLKTESVCNHSPKFKDRVRHKVVLGIYTNRSSEITGCAELYLNDMDVWCYATNSGYLHGNYQFVTEHEPSFIPDFIIEEYRSNNTPFSISNFMEERLKITNSIADAADEKKVESFFSKPNYPDIVKNLLFDISNTFKRYSGVDSFEKADSLSKLFFHDALVSLVAIDDITPEKVHEFYVFYFTERRYSYAYHFNHKTKRCPFIKPYAQLHESIIRDFEIEAKTIKALRKLVLSSLYLDQ